MSIDREKLKKIRWFSNGVWQFQPHLHFMQNLYESEEKFDEAVSLLEVGGMIQKQDNFFKMELVES
jgi:hypothetical protein